MTAVPRKSRVSAHVGQDHPETQEHGSSARHPGSLGAVATSITRTASDPLRCAVHVGESLSFPLGVWAVCRASSVITLQVLKNITVIIKYIVYNTHHLNHGKCSVQWHLNIHSVIAAITFF